MDTNLMRVWIVLQGNFSSMKIKAVFSNLAAAEQFETEFNERKQSAYSEDMWIWESDAGFEVLDVAPSPKDPGWSAYGSLNTNTGEVQFYVNPELEFEDGQYVPGETEEVTETWRSEMLYVTGSGPDRDMLEAEVLARINAVKLSWGSLIPKRDGPRRA